jgi:hypothetical protein
MVASQSTERRALAQVPPPVSPEARIRALDAALVDIDQRGLVTVAHWAGLAPRDRATLAAYRPMGHDAPWTRADIVAFARRVSREVANGVNRAVHYLKALGFELQAVLQALFPARAFA